MTNSNNLSTATLTEFEKSERSMSPSNLLIQYGFPKFPVKREIRYLFIFLIVVGSAVVWYFGGKDFTGFVFGCFIFLFAFQQWKEARYETTLDKYYERLELANSRLEKRDNANKDIMYVFMELDNLEYVIEKHKRGYIEAEQAARGLRTFHSHCKNIFKMIDEDNTEKSFRDLAYKWVHKAGYQDTTKQVVSTICNEFGNISAS